MSSSELFVGNLAFTMNDESLRALFAEAGSVESAKVITDRATGRSRGFGFVKMATPEEASKAIEKLNNRDIQGRPLRVNFSNSDNQSSSSPRPRSSAPRNGGGGNGGGSFQRRSSESRY